MGNESICYMAPGGPNHDRSIFPGVPGMRAVVSHVPLPFGRILPHGRSDRELLGTNLCSTAMTQCMRAEP